MFIFLFAIIVPVSVFGNTLVICVILKSKELRHTQYVYKISIAVADFIWGLTISYIFLEQCCLIFSKNIDINLYRDFKLTTSCSKKSDLLVCYYKVSNTHSYLTLFNFDSTFIDVKEFFEFMFMPITIFASIITLVFSAADRYFALTFPFKYKITNTKKLAKIISLFVWVTIISVYIPFFIKSKRHYSIYYNRILQPCLHCTTESDLQKFNMVIVFVSFFLLWVFTILTLVSLKNNYKKLKMLNRRARKAFAAEKQMCMILILMVFAFSFSLLPTMYNYIYSTFFKNSLP